MSEIKGKKYCRRAFLNGPTSPSTGSCAAYHGPGSWAPHTADMFFEVGDCRDKARLHKTDLDSPMDFLNKLRKLRSELDRFITFLEKLYDKNAGVAEMD